MNSNNFKGKLLSLLTMVGVVSILFITSCGDDDGDPAVDPSSISFSSANLVVAENSGDLSVTVNLSEAAPVNGTFDIQLSGATYGEDYTTDPDGSSGTISIEVTEGSSFRTFTFTPTDNDELDGDKTVTLTLANAGDGVELGGQATLTITIEDDEGPAAVNFAQASQEVVENVGPVTVDLSLAVASDAAGTIDVNITGGTYDTDYTTDPDGSTGTFTLTIDQGATGASFTVNPIDNDVADENRVISFALANATGGLELGSGITTFELTITNEDAAVTPLSEIRALFDGTDVDITEATLITGTVISDASVTTGRNVIIQDETAGIVLRFNENHSLQRGDVIEVDINGGTVSDFNNLVQVGGELPLTTIQSSTAGTLPDPQVITVEQANTGDFESQLVSIENLLFVGADGTATLSDNNNNNNASDGTNEIIVRATGPLGDIVIPFGMGTVTGAMGIFGTGIQILPQVATDIFESGPGATLTITGTLNDFGSVMSDAVSESQSFMVTGENLMGNISITAPANFQVSLNDTDFDATVEIDQSATGATTVFVRFAPTVGVSGERDGDIVITSSQATTQTIAVSGTEASESTSTLLLEENFEYGTTEGLFVNGGAGIGTEFWEAHSGSGNNAADYVNNSLSFVGYPSSQIGGSIVRNAASGSIEDINRNFTDVTSGRVYAAALVNVTGNASTNQNGDYFLHFKAQDEFAFFSRVTIREDDGGNLLFGMEELGGDVIFSETAFEYGTTYLVVLIYDFATSTSELHVLANAAPTTEPMPLVSVNDEGSNATLLNEIAVRGDSDNPTITIDGIRVALDWESVIGAE